MKGNTLNPQQEDKPHQPQRDAEGRFLPGPTPAAVKKRAYVPGQKCDLDRNRDLYTTKGNVTPWQDHLAQLCVIGQMLYENPEPDNQTARNMAARKARVEWVKGTDYLEMLEALGIPAERIELSDEDKELAEMYRSAKRRKRRAA